MNMFHAMFVMFGAFALVLLAVAVLGALGKPGNRCSGRRTRRSDTWDPTMGATMGSDTSVHVHDANCGHGSHPSQDHHSSFDSTSDSGDGGGGGSDGGGGGGDGGGGGGGD